MKEVRFLGEVVTLSGEFPEVGKKAPNFMLTNVELNELQMKSFEGEKIVLAISPSIDTPVCQESVSKFNELASKFPNVNMVCVSADLPFALERFGKERKLNDVIMASFFRTADFASNYGVKIAEGPLSNLSARAVLVINEHGIVDYAELVEEITNQPDFGKLLEILEGKKQ